MPAGLPDGRYTGAAFGYEAPDACRYHSPAQTDFRDASARPRPAARSSAHVMSPAWLRRPSFASAAVAATTRPLGRTQRSSPTLGRHAAQCRPRRMRVIGGRFPCPDWIPPRVQHNRSRYRWFGWSGDGRRSRFATEGRATTPRRPRERRREAEVGLLSRGVQDASYASLQPAAVAHRSMNPARSVYTGDRQPPRKV